MKQILYGTELKYIDVTLNCVNLFKKGTNRIGNEFFIPPLDGERCRLFGDPLSGILKHIIILYENEREILPHGTPKYINFNDIDINSFSRKEIDFNTDVLQQIHKNNSLLSGTFKDELVEQKMTLKFLRSNSKVLEIGGNIGRNSMVIASILDDEKNLVVLESNRQIAKLLKFNRDNNGFKFHILDSALSYRPLIQNGWVSKPSSENKEGESVKTLTFEYIEEKYNIEFNAIVADCEGALFYILKDNKNIMKNIRTVIIENDFSDLKHKEFVNEIFKEFGLSCIYSEPLLNNEYNLPCADYFYEVWKRV